MRARLTLVAGVVLTSACLDPVASARRQGPACVATHQAPCDNLDLRSELRSPTATAQPTWTRIMLPLDNAYGINDDGVVVGVVKNAAAYWAPGVRKVLHAPPAQPKSYVATDVNELKAVVGLAWMGSNIYRALYWKDLNTAAVDLGDLGGGRAEALAINDSGVVVGNSTLAASPLDYHAFKWTAASGMKDINPPGYTASVALDVSNDGTIVGMAEYTGPGYKRAAVKWDPKGNITILAAGPSTDVWGRGVDRAGTVAGMLFGRATLWAQNGTATYIGGSLQARAASRLSDVQRAVGYFYPSIGGVKPWTTRTGVETALPVATTESGDATDVNTCGWVVGWSNYAAYNYRTAGTLWKPSTCDQ